MAKLKYVGGTTAGSETVDVAAWDGVWSQVKSTTATTISSQTPSVHVYANPTGVSSYSALDTSSSFLYGTTGTPLVASINQGGFSDCWFLSTLAEVAEKNPNAIKNMITADGNGIYTVALHINGVVDNVAVNDQLATGANTANNNGNWASLIEKAYAAVEGDSYTTAFPSSGGMISNAYKAITGQSTTYYNPATNSSSLITNMISSLNKGCEVSLASNYYFTSYSAGARLSIDNNNGQAVPFSSGGHAYAVLGYDSAHSAFIVYNPWGQGQGQSGLTSQLSSTSLSSPVKSSSGQYLTEFEMTAADIAKYANQVDISAATSSSSSATPTQSGAASLPQGSLAYQDYTGLGVSVGATSLTSGSQKYAQSGALVGSA